MKLQISKLSFKYKDKTIFNETSYTFKSGCITGLIGENGVGKTTLLNLIANNNEYYGAILIDNFKITKEDIYLINSTPNLPDFLTGREYLEYFKKITKREIELKKYLNIVNFKKEDLDKLILEYSHGMKNKLEIITALIINPKVLLLDEPLLNLDITTQEEIKELLLKIKDNHIVIISSHIMDFVFNICDEVAIIKDKKIMKIEKDKKEIIKSLKGSND